MQTKKHLNFQTTSDAVKSFEITVQILENLSGQIVKSYNQSIKPMLDEMKKNLTEELSSITEKLVNSASSSFLATDNYNEYVYSKSNTISKVGIQKNK